MQVAKCQRNLCRIKLSLAFREAFLVRQVFEKFAALDEVHDEVNAESLLEHVIHANDEGMVDLQQNKLLNFERLH